MLSECREIYVKSASSIPDYKKIPQMELIDKYLEGGPRSEAYLSALILRYWNIIDKQLYKDKGLYDEKEAYDRYIEALMYAIQYQPWKSEDSSLHGDPKAIEKLLNTCVNCSRANWFQASNRLKRKINHGIGSLESLQEDYNDSFLPADMYEETSVFSYQNLVVRYFNRQQYLLALMLDVIVNDISFTTSTDDKGIIQAIKKSIRSLPDNYSQIFAETYSLDAKQVETSFKYIYNMSDVKLKQSIEVYLYKLRSVLTKEL